MRVEGEEAGRFLQGMVTADMEEEREAGRAFYSMMLNAQVRKQGRGGSWWMYVVMRCVVMRCGCVSEGGVDHGGYVVMRCVVMRCVVMRCVVMRCGYVSEYEPFSFVYV